MIFKKTDFFKGLRYFAGGFLMFMMLFSTPSHAGKVWVETPDGVRFNAAGDIVTTDETTIELGDNEVITADGDVFNYINGTYTPQGGSPIGVNQSGGATRSGNTTTAPDGTRVIRYEYQPPRQNVRGPLPPVEIYYTIETPDNTLHNTRSTETVTPSNFTFNYTTAAVYSSGGEIQPPQTPAEDAVNDISASNPSAGERLFYVEPLAAAGIFESYDDPQINNDDPYDTDYDNMPRFVQAWRPAIEAGLPIVIAFNSSATNALAGANSYYELKPFVFTSSYYFCAFSGRNPDFCEGQGASASSVPDRVAPSGTETVDSSGIPDITSLTANVLGLTFAQMFEGGEQTVNHWNQLWENQMLPGLQNMTAQWNTAIMDQTRNMGSMQDAASQLDYQRATQEREVADRRANKPSELTCVVSSHTPKLATSGHLGRAVSRGLSYDIAKTGLNARGTPAEFGPVTDTGARYDSFRRYFCDADTNQGNVNCLPDSETIPDGDVSIENMLLRDTINLDSPAQQQAVYALTRNLVASEVEQNIPASALEGTAARDEMIRRRELQALRDMSAATVGNIIGRRTAVPGTNTALTIRPLREKAGVDPNEISDKPSRNEVLLALTKERFFDPDYFVKLNDNPGTIKQEQLGVDILTGIVLQDIYELQEQLSALLAARASLKFNSYQFGSLTESAPASSE